MTYDDDGSIIGWSVEPVKPFGESVEDLQADVHYFLQAFRRPVLKEEVANDKTVLVEVNQGHYLELLDRVWVTLGQVELLIRRDRNTATVTASTKPGTSSQPSAD